MRSSSALQSARISAFTGATASSRPSASSSGTAHLHAHAVVVPVQSLGALVGEQREVRRCEREVLLREAEPEERGAGHGARVARRLRACQPR